MFLSASLVLFSRIKDLMTLKPMFADLLELLGLFDAGRITEQELCQMLSMHIACRWSASVEGECGPAYF